MQVKVNTLEDKVTGYQHRLLKLERKVQEQESDKDFMAGKEVTQSHKMRYYENQIKALNEQVSNLEMIFEQSELRVAALMKEKNESQKRKAKELYEETFSVMKVNLSKEVESLVNKVNEL